MLEVYKKVENTRIHGLKISPEKTYELARSNELAPYELAQHTCINPCKEVGYVLLDSTYQTTL